MKKQLLIIGCILWAFSGYAQKIEVSVQANTGMFRFSGTRTNYDSYINEGVDDKSSYTNNPYSNNNTVSWGFNVQTQLVTKTGFIAGLQTGYDILRSRTTITTINPRFYPDYSVINSFIAYYFNYYVTGNTYLTNRFINVSPYVGYRISIKQVKLDVMPGMDIGFNLSSYEKGSAKQTNDPGQEYRVDRKLANTPTDYRLKMGAAVYYKRIGLTGSVAWGLTDYRKEDIGGVVSSVHSKLFRVGLSYRID